VVERKLTGGGVRFALRFRAHGERQYETLGTDAEGWDRARAQEALGDRLAEVRLGTYIAPHRGGTVAQDAAVPTFHQFASEWFAQVEPELRESTVDAIRWRLSYVLLPFWQHHQLSDITIAEVDRYRAAKVHERDQLTAARARGEKIDRRPLSNSTINRTIGLLAQILDVAVEYGHIPANPARGKRRKLKADRPTRAYLDSAAQITALLDAAAELDRGSRKDRQHIHRRAQLATLIFAGLRIGEFLALRWGDVDLAGGWITVRESKTDAGRRKVKIRPVLRDVLLAHKPLDASPGAYVFATGQGKALHSSNVRVRVLSKAVERANERLEEAGEPPLPRLTPHGLRRTFASLLYGTGETSPVVMAEMGHTDPALALSIYAAAMRREPGEDERLRALVDGVELEDLGTSAHSEAEEIASHDGRRSTESRSASGV
jgi:integrase